MQEFNHITVLQNELVDQLNLKPGGIAVDCTLGGGGHTEMLLKAVGGAGCVISIDRDQDAIKVAEKKFAMQLSNKN